jgi:adenylate cyclase
MPDGSPLGFSGMANPSEPKHWSSRLKFLIHPISIGIYWTLAWVLVVASYFDSRDISPRETLMTSILREVDQKSFDYRLILRGERPGSEQVAVLAVDDESLAEIGRWPWPRQTMALVYKNAIEAGARVIASDIVYSEPQLRPEQILADRIGAQVKWSGQDKALVTEELRKLDGDRIFAETLREIRSHVVLGNFYLKETRFSDQPYHRGWRALCERVIFDLSPAAKMWNMDGLFLIAQDPNEFFLPEIIQAAYKENLAQLQPEEQEQFCRTDFLDPAKDPVAEFLSQNWGDVRQADKNIQASSFQEWFEFLDQNYLKNRVMSASGWVINIPEFYADGSFNGFFNAYIDKGGVIRRSQLFARNGDFYVPSISLKAFLVANGYAAKFEINSTPEIPGTKGPKEIAVLDGEGQAVFSFPIEAQGSHLINYAGPQKMFPYIRAADLVDPNRSTITVTQRVFNPKFGKWGEESRQEDKKSFLKDKILVAGATAMAVYDLRNTPFEERYPGVETHANFLDNLIRQDFLRIPEEESAQMLIFMLVLGLVTSLALSQFGAVSGMVLLF